MTLGFLLVIIIIVAVALWLIPSIDPTLRKILLAIVVVAFLLWLLAALGIVGEWGYVRRVR